MVFYGFYWWWVGKGGLFNYVGFERNIIFVYVCGVLWFKLFCILWLIYELCLKYFYVDWVCCVCFFLIFMWNSLNFIFVLIVFNISGGSGYLRRRVCDGWKVIRRGRIRIWFDVSG